MAGISAFSGIFSRVSSTVWRFFLGNGLAVVHQIAHEGDEFERLFFDFDVGGFEAGEGEQLAHQRVHAHQLVFQFLQVLFLLLRLRLDKTDDGLHPRQRGAHFVGNVVQQVAFFGDELLQFVGHFVKLGGKLGEFVVAVVHLLRDAGFKIAFGQPVHAAPEDADGAGDVAGEDVGQGEADQEDEAQNDDFVPGLFQRQAGDEQRAGAALDFGVVPVADEEQVFFAPAAVFEVDAFASGFSSARRGLFRCVWDRLCARADRPGRRR